MEDGHRDKRFKSDSLWFHDNSDGSDVESQSNQESDVFDDEAIEWEDVPLEKRGISVTIQKHELLLPKKKINHYQKYCYALHLVEIPLMLLCLKKRAKYANDERLTRRLKRSVPKLINAKLRKIKLDSSDVEIQTALLGLVFWFRSNYKCNSNGFRQNFTRMQYLSKYEGSESKLYQEVLNQTEQFYGKRPIVENIESIRNMARKKMANRDWLTFFFYIILKHLFPLFKIRLCFALPLHSYSISSRNPKAQILNGIGKVPNRFDTDLLSPYFWVEVMSPDNRLWVVDPLVNLNSNEIVHKTTEDKFVPHISPSLDLKLDIKQKFFYVVSIDQNGDLMDVSPRYISSISYRYQSPPAMTLLRSQDFASFLTFRKWMRRFSPSYEHQDEYRKMINLALTNYKVPITLKACKKSMNFIVPSLLKSTEVIRQGSETIGRLHKENIFWRRDVIRLKSRQHWATLGRSIKIGSAPMKLKTYRTLNMRRQNSHDSILKELFSFNQTTETPPLPHTIFDDDGREHPITDVNFYKNDHGNIELYKASQCPVGFELIENNQTTRDIIQDYNKTATTSREIKFLKVVSGFDFKSTPGYAVPIKEHLIVHIHHYNIFKRLLKQHLDYQNIVKWRLLLKKLAIKHRVEENTT